MIAGGLSNPASTTTEHAFLCLDLKNLEGGWKELPAWPGPSRMLAIAGANKDRFYLFSGTQVVDGKRVYLKDAYSYQEKTGWQKLANLPHPVVAAPSPAFNDPGKALYIFGGDTGKDAAEAAVLRERHPGFSKEILCYEPSKGVWSVAGEIYTQKKKDAVERPNNSIWAPVTTTLAVWKHMIVIAGGEVRPGTRTPNVLIAKFQRM